MTWKSLRPAARTYVTAVISLGGLGLTLALAAGPPSIDGMLVAVMLVAGAAGSLKLMLVGRPGEGDHRTQQMSTMSLGFPVVLGPALFRRGRGDPGRVRQCGRRQLVSA